MDSRAWPARSPSWRARGSASARSRRPGRHGAGRRGPTARRRTRRGPAPRPPRRRGSPGPSRRRSGRSPSISPWRAITWLAGKSTSMARFATAAKSGGWTPENSRQDARSSVRRSCVSVKGPPLGRCWRGLRRTSTGVCHDGRIDACAGCPHAASRLPQRRSVANGHPRGDRRRDRGVRPVRRSGDTAAGARRPHFEEQVYAEGERVLRQGLSGRRST